MFPSNPRAWSLPKLDRSADIEGRDYLEAIGMAPLFFHAPYLVNLASESKEIQEKSAASLRYALRRAMGAGARGVIVHAGSHGQASRSDGVRRVARIAAALLKGADGPDVVFELTAGGGHPVASHPVHMRDLLDALDGHRHVKFCIDTQHLFAAGYDWRASGGVDSLVADIDRYAGIERIACFHVNDSKSPLGSGLDRHEVIGKGLIGVDAYRRLVAHSRMRGVPLILETPGALEEHASEVKLLRELARKK